MSAGGLSRRRVAASSTEESSSAAPSPTLSPGPFGNGDAPGRHAGSALEGGSKVAFDPRDLEDDGAREGGRPPKLTIMEEVLLLGLKDKQVGVLRSFSFAGAYGGGMGRQR
jgi:Golgi phosphoprotein 3